MAFHSHKCPDRTCNYVWSHDDAELRKTDEQTYDAAHKCPDCGALQRTRFFATPQEEEAFYEAKFKESVERLKELRDKERSGKGLTESEFFEGLDLAMMLGVLK